MRFELGEKVSTVIHYNNETGKEQVRDVAVYFGTYNRETGGFTSDQRMVIGHELHFEMNKAKSCNTGIWHIPSWLLGTYDIMLALGHYDFFTDEFVIRETYIKENYIEIYP